MEVNKPLEDNKQLEYKLNEEYLYFLSKKITLK